MFFMWLVRANKNARALGAWDMEYTPGWTVGWFFVPFANLFKPYDVVQELYQASDPESDADSWSTVEAPRTILGWWLSWIAFGVSGSLSSSSQPGSYAAWLPSLCGALAAGLAISVLGSIDRRQVERRIRLGSAPPPPPDMVRSHRFL